MIDSFVFFDTERAYQVTEMLAAIAHEQGRGVVMITHDTPPSW